MGCNRCECTCIGLILAVLAGVTLGVLFSLGFVATGIIFWALLATGVAAFFAAPVYAALSDERDRNCFCRNKLTYLVGAIGTVVASVIGLLISPVATVLLVSIITGLSVFFVVLLLSVLVCITNCLCRE